ncbi:SRPBCC family protein [Arthrobacter agilis]|uniref:SRPBCC family protein n=1 Tax=Arthrobacter agilis TaxID=37921 RepID=UPI000B363B9F|nr:SRPBCC family protein [Arthrobacter agilis]OUM40611.1 polyketide cyclase [Arthrobacter agilis]PPB45222.1 SRPBCC family protein [Arthrobacter agilis]TPV27925.1 SRPBCC family protein [Arthrobacter agilis]VDR31393.1 Polyketide cyclase / dehydrase and lipid transport [Arthrobacter agilis]
MGRVISVEDSVVIAQSPQVLYGMVSDVTRMGEWSPENRGAVLASPHEGVRVGAVFDGANTRGRVSWTTRCTVTAADPGREFAFRVHAIGSPTRRLPARIATWRYTFEEHDGGTLVTEAWTDDRRWHDAAARAFDYLATGGSTIAAFQRGNILRTLRTLKAAAETDTGR